MRQGGAIPAPPTYFVRLTYLQCAHANATSTSLNSRAHDTQTLQRWPEPTLQTAAQERSRCGKAVGRARRSWCWTNCDSIILNRRRRSRSRQGARSLHASAGAERIGVEDAVTGVGSQVVRQRGPRLMPFNGTDMMEDQGAKRHNKKSILISTRVFSMTMASIIRTATATKSEEPRERVFNRRYADRLNLNRSTWREDARAFSVQWQARTPPNRISAQNRRQRLRSTLMG